MSEIEREYQQALDYIYSFIDYEKKRVIRNAEENFKLERMRHFLQILGDPHLRYKVIHVAGTKGKGSVCAFLESALRASGYKVGMYTSPHMVDFRERIQVNREWIDQQSMVRLTKKLKQTAEKVPDITTFEMTTALGFLYFAEQDVDVAVIEVGLGGRLDATNVVEPLVTVISSISYDHTEILGDSLAKIAYEKGGIIKKSVPLIISPQRYTALKILQKVSKERYAPTVIVGKDILFGADTHSLDGQSLFVWAPQEQELVNEFINSGGDTEWSPLRLTIPLLGYHQVANAATAYAALRKADECGLPVSTEAIKTGFQNTTWQGRFEILSLNPRLVVDSAHNRDSALKLRQTINDYFPGIPVILIFGVSSDKDYSGILEELLPRTLLVIASQSIHPRALDAEVIYKQVLKFGKPCIAYVPIEEALARSLDIAGEEALVVATGSVFVAAAIKDIWNSKQTPKS